MYCTSILPLELNSYWWELWTMWARVNIPCTHTVVAAFCCTRDQERCTLQMGRRREDSKRVEKNQTNEEEIGKHESICNAEILMCSCSCLRRGVGTCFITQIESKKEPSDILQLVSCVDEAVPNCLCAHKSLCDMLLRQCAKLCMTTFKSMPFNTSFYYVQVLESCLFFFSSTSTWIHENDLLMAALNTIIQTYKSAVSPFMSSKDQCLVEL